MKKAIRLRSEPYGDGYKALIDYAIANGDTFVVGVHRYEGIDEEVSLYTKNYADLLTKLLPFRVAEYTFEELRQTSGVAYTPGVYYAYRCCEEAGALLKEAADSLYAWRGPDLPEDLTFRDREGNDFLLNIAHEEIGRLSVEEAEAERLSNEIEGLFLELSRHVDFDKFLDDAIRHQALSLHIENFGITEIPPRIGKLKRLKQLTLFEQNVRRLPRELFDIETLEELTIYCADLEEIPPEIGRLKRLRSLSIIGGSYYGVPVGGVIPKAAMSLNRLPDEIGELEALEHLTVNHTGIRELPGTMAGLRRLVTCNVENNLLDKRPGLLYELPRIRYVFTGSNPYSERKKR